MVVDVVAVVSSARDRFCRELVSGGGGSSCCDCITNVDSGDAFRLDPLGFAFFAMLAMVELNVGGVVCWAM